MATKFLHDYRFPTTLEREIWRLHTDGMSLREISAELHRLNFRFFKDKIHHIVKNLEATMLGRESPYEKKVEGQATLDFGGKHG